MPNARNNAFKSYKMKEPTHNIFVPHYENLQLRYDIIPNIKITRWIWNSKVKLHNWLLITDSKNMMTISSNEVLTLRTKPHCKTHIHYIYQELRGSSQVFLLFWISASLCKCHLWIIEFQQYSFWYIGSYWKSIVHQMCECVWEAFLTFVEWIVNWIERRKHISWQQSTYTHAHLMSCKAERKGASRTIYVYPWYQWWLCKTTHHGRIQC